MTVDAKNLPSPEDLHFGHFAAVPEYRQVNRQLVQELFRHMPNPFVHVDLATGTGLVPQLLIEEAERRGFRGTIIGIDRSPKALEIAEATTPRPSNIDLRFVEADARYLERLQGDELPADGADSLSIHDAIHEITDQEGQRQVYNGMAAIAREGALLSSNSTFTTVSMAVANSLRGHGEWKLHFMRLTGARRNDKGGSLPYRRPEDYRKMIEEAGFKVVHELERAIHLTREALKGHRPLSSVRGRRRGRPGLPPQLQPGRAKPLPQPGRRQGALRRPAPHLARDHRAEASDAVGSPASR